MKAENVRHRFPLIIRKQKQQPVDHSLLKGNTCLPISKRYLSLPAHSHVEAVIRRWARPTPHAGDFRSNWHDRVLVISRARANCLQKQCKYMWPVFDINKHKYAYTGWVKSSVTCSGCCNAITALHVDVKFRVQTISTTANTMSQSYGCLYSRILDFWVSEGWFCWVSVAIG